MANSLSSQVTALRKEGKLQEAWDIACPAVQESPQDTYLKGAFFWLCYAYIKDVQGIIKERADNNGNYRPNRVEFERIEFLLNWIIWLNLPGGGYEYRSLLLIFQRNIEHFPILITLLCQQQSSLFDPGDEKPFVNEKGESPSLMLKFARGCVKGWLEHNSLRPQLNIRDLVVLLGNVRSRMKDNKGAIWLDYDQAKCLIAAGELVEARDFVIPVLRKKQNEPWAWGALAATYYKSDPAMAICLFCEGLRHVHDEKFALKLWVGLAPLLTESGDVEQASMCIKKAINIYQNEGWKLKPNLEKLSQSSWYDHAVDVNKLAIYVENRAQGALQCLLGDTTSLTGIVENIHLSGKGFHVYIDRHTSVSVRLGLFKSKAAPEPGSFVAVQISDDDEVVDARPVEAVDIKDAEAYFGKLRVSEKGFGFVDDTFVPPYLIKQEYSDSEVCLTRVMSKDKKKGTFGWKAIKLEPAV